MILCTSAWLPPKRLSNSQKTSKPNQNPRLFSDPRPKKRGGFPWMVQNAQVRERERLLFLLATAGICHCFISLTNAAWSFHNFIFSEFPFPISHWLFLHRRERGRLIEDLGHSPLINLHRRRRCRVAGRRLRVRVRVKSSLLCASKIGFLDFHNFKFSFTPKGGLSKKREFSSSSNHSMRGIRESR